MEVQVKESEVQVEEREKKSTLLGSSIETSAAISSSTSTTIYTSRKCVASTSDDCCEDIDCEELPGCSFRFEDTACSIQNDNQTTSDSLLMSATSQQSRKRQPTANESEFQQACSSQSQDDDIKAKRRHKNQMYYMLNKHNILEKRRSTYAGNKTSILTKRKVKYTERKQTVLDARKKHYAQNREAVLIAKREHYAKNRKTVLDARREHYAENTGTVLDARREHYAENTATVLDARREHYAENTTTVLDARREHYADNTATVLDARRQHYAENRETILQHHQANYLIPEIRANQLHQMSCSRKSNRRNIPTVVLKFKSEILQEKPIFTCIICDKSLFRTQVLQFHKEKYSRNSLLTTMPSTVDFTALPHSNTWICFTCHNNIRKDITPRLSRANKFLLCPVPQELSELNILERHLIAPVIPFMKLVPLYKGCQKGIHGQVVCVKADVDKTAKSLPRLANDDSIVRVKLKRKLKYKNHVLFKQVSPSKIRLALNLLKESNPLFEDIAINCDQLDVNNSDPIMADSQDQQHSFTESQMLDEEEHNLHIIQEKILQNQYDQHDVNDSQMVDNEEQHEQTDQEQVSDPTEDNDITNTSAPLMSFLQPVDFGQYIADNCDNTVLSLAPAEGSRPTAVLDMEAQAFPVLFPDGKNTFAEEREPKVSPSRYFNARLFSQDARFASDPQYIFFAQYCTELQMISSQISIAMRQGHTKTTDGRPITSEILTDKELVNQMIQRDEGYRYLRSIRGMPAYWEKTLKDLFAMIRQIGIPTWFVTFSAADRRWLEIDNAILEQQGKEPLSPEEHADMDWATHCNIIYSNPVTAARMFEHRVKKFIKQVIQSDAHPIGHVVDYFYRTEFQQRGWPHIHMLVWVDNAPDPCTDSDDTIEAFIDKYISCELPSEEDDPELHEIVQSCQTHSKRHTKSCRKTGKTCRFGFPKPPSEQTFICRSIDSSDDAEDQDESQDDSNDGKEKAKEEAKRVITQIWEVIQNPETQITNLTSTSDILNSANVTQEDMQKSLQLLSSHSTVYQKRKPVDIWINNYNQDLLRAWNGNMDIQLVLDAYSCVKYILSYISKTERQMGDLLRQAQKEAQQGNSDAITELRKVGNIYLHHRELSVMECIYRVCSMHLRDCTRQVVFVQTDPDGQRISLPLNVLRNEQPDRIWMSNALDKYYARPNVTKFKMMCLATFMSKFRFTSSNNTMTSTESDGDSNEQSGNSTHYQLDNNHGIAIERRCKSCIVRYPKLYLKKDPEKYYMNILRMYLPHRDIKLIPANMPSFSMYYHNGTVKTDEGNKPVSQVVRENMKLYEPVNNQIDAAWEALHLQTTHWKMLGLHLHHKLNNNGWMIY